MLGRRVLIEGGERMGGEIPFDPAQEGLLYPWLKPQPILTDRIVTSRFHVMPDGRLFVICYVGGADAEGREVSENRLIDLAAPGSATMRVPLQRPFTQFFTATPRAGSSPSDVIDLLGFLRGDMGLFEGKGLTVSYARIRMREAPPSS